MDDLLHLFKNPPAEYRAKPFWAWNGKLEKDELLRQVGILKEMGFGGYFMHSRTGLATEYLGEEWFGLINACADEGQKAGMESWLYDEDRWPSGTAGGMVTQNPAFRRKFLRMSWIPASELVWDGHMISAYIADCDGLRLTDYTRLTPGSAVPHGAAAVLCCTVEGMRPSGFYNGFTDVDRLSREATEEFIRLTHMRYRDKCGDRIGENILGIFTDEPHRGQVMSSFSEVTDNPEWCVPWSEGLADDFKAHHSYELLDRLPELFFWYHGEKISEVKWHFIETLQRLFLTNFMKPVYDWCQANDLKLTGHVLHEDSLSAQTAVCGSVMRCYEYMDSPGVDVLTEYNRGFWIVKQLTSAARQLGKKQLLSELYGCTGWQFNFEGHKKVGDWQAFFGINLRCPHLCWYTMEGEAKRDFPGSIFYQSAWWREYRYVEDYFSRLSTVMDRGAPLCDVLVINPVESVWSRVHPGWCSGLDGRAPEVLRLESQYKMVFHWLCGGRIDFDYGDEDMLARLGSVAQSGGDALLRVGEAVYRKVLVAGLDTIRSSTLTLLEKFREKGGEVVFAGEAPIYVDAIKSAACSDFAKTCVQAKLDRSLSDALAPEYPIVEICSANGKPARDIYAQIRQNDRETIILLWNSNPEKAYRGVKAVFHREGTLLEWDCETGGCCRIAEFNGEQTPVKFDFEGSQWHLLTFAPDAPEDMPERRTQQGETSVHKLQGPFRYTLDEENVCVLDYASCRVDGETFGPDEILKIDRKLRKRFKMPFRGGEMVQPWFTGKKSEATVGRIVLNYEFFVENLPAGEVCLAVETPQNFSILVNGKALACNPSGYWIDRCFDRLEIDPDMLKIGRNEIALSADFREGLNLETIYLLGGFGVALNGNRKTLMNLPDTLEIGDIARQGLPFYGGSISYHTGEQISSDSGCTSVMRTVGTHNSAVCKGYAGACVKAVCGDVGRVIAWAPYEADLTGMEGELTFELVLTRRNTFGPLHEKPLYVNGYGPENFLTQGDRFSPDHMLVPAGLMEPPGIKHYDIDCE